jgi:integrase
VRRTVGRLTSLGVRNAKPPKGRDAVMLADGGCLYLQCTRGEGDHIRRSWIFRYELDFERHEIGLGGIDTRGLKEAREEAKRLRLLLLQGIDPLEAKRDDIERRRQERLQRAAELAKRKTFAECAATFLAKHADGWKNAKHRAQWKSTLETYANPVIGDLFVADIATPHIVKLLEPIWNTKRETARRVLNRVERVLNYAKASGYRTGDNPAKWTGHLKDLLPSNGKTVEHHAALPYSEIPQFMAELRERDSLSARALELCILTASRTSEVIGDGASWDEFDLKGKTWLIGAERMKAGKEHKVPLCDRAVEILRGLGARGDKAKVFPLSNMAMLELLRGMRPGHTVHGFRSTFRDWAAETTAYPNHVVEQALAHAIGDKVEAAYRRGDLFKKRVRLMQQWADYCAKPAAALADDTLVLLRKVGADA